jgi:hypothetical protein
MYDLIKDAANAIPFVLVDASGVEVAGLGNAFTVTVSKNGGAFGASAGAKAELAGGWYLYTATTGECNTAGPLALKITGAGAAQQNLVYRVAVEPLKPSVAGRTLAVDAEGIAWGNVKLFNSNEIGEDRLINTSDNELFTWLRNMIGYVAQGELGYWQWNAPSLELAPGLTAQETADAVSKMAPTAGDPAAGSMGKHLDDIVEDTGTTLPAAIAALPTAAANATAAAAAILVTPANKLATAAGGAIDDLSANAQQDVADAVSKLAPTAGAPAAGSVGKHLDDIVEDTSTTLPALISAGTGTGLYSETITVNDGNGLPLDGVLVQVATDSAFSNVVRSGHTNNLGKVTLNFDAVGTYYGRAEISDFNVSTFTVTVS